MDKIFNNDVEDVIFLDLNNKEFSVMIFIYISKLTHNKYFKKWFIQPDINDTLKRMSHATEIEDISKWKEEIELRKNAKKYNL